MPRLAPVTRTVLSAMLTMMTISFSSHVVVRAGWTRRYGSPGQVFQIEASMRSGSPRTLRRRSPIRTCLRGRSRRRPARRRRAPSPASACAKTGREAHAAGADHPPEMLDRGAQAGGGAQEGGTAALSGAGQPGARGNLGQVPVHRRHLLGAVGGVELACRARASALARTTSGLSGQPAGPRARGARAGSWACQCIRVSRHLLASRPVRSRLTGLPGRRGQVLRRTL